MDSSRPKLRAVAFDLFHTLVDPEQFRPKLFLRPPEIAKLLGIPVIEFTEAWNALSDERQVTLRPTVVERVQSLCQRFGVAPRPEVWPQVDAIWGRFTDLALLNPQRNVVETLRRLRENGWKLGVVSNCDEREMRSWGRSELAPLFDAAVFSCEVGFAKPAAEAYRALVPRWGGIPLEEAVFVGDGSNDELAGARRAGFAKVVFQFEFVSVNQLRPAERNRELRAQADATLGKLADVLRLLPEKPDT